MHSNHHRSYFLVASTGRTATQWLAAVLNSHPMIYCSHGFAWPELIREMAQSGSEANSIMWRNRSRFEALSIAEFLHLHELETGKFFVGNIHGYGMAAISHNLRSRGADQTFYIPTRSEGTDRRGKRELRVVNLIRHPILQCDSMTRRILIDSQKGQLEFRKHFRQSCATLAALEIDDEFVIRHFSDDEVWAYVYALGISIDAVRDSAFPVGQFRMEDVVSRPEELERLIRAVCGSEIELGRDFASESLRTSPKDVTNEAPMDAEETFSGWPEWKRRVFSHYFARPKVREVLTRHEYSLPF